MKEETGKRGHYYGVDIDTALDKAQADIIKDMKSSSFQSVENLYEFAK
jgi:multiple sugar transport system substrate-binding protein